MDFDQSLEYLLSLGHETLAMKLGLDSTLRLLETLNNPHNAFFKVQIAGTNGKGSTAAMLEAVCRKAGIRTGLFTSPHLVSITERIRVAGAEIKRDEFARIATRGRSVAQDLVDNGTLPALPTFFEHVTAIALLAFAEAKVELAILETGLGGRLDSTTAAGAEVVAITPIALDHQEYLGVTLAEIASEKAAIIRPGVIAVIAPQYAEALDVICKRCAECDVEPYLIGASAEVVDVTPDGKLKVTITTKNETYEDVTIGLRGRHQINNASVAAALAEALRERGFNISRGDIVAGIGNAEHRGRLEIHEGRPSILYDGAHNPDGARALAAYLDEFVNRPVTLIFGAMRDKDLHEIASYLFPRAKRIVLTELDNPRGARADTLMDVATKVGERTKATVTFSVQDAIDSALECTPEDGLVCVTGSLYLIGEAQSLLASSSGFAAVALRKAFGFPAGLR